MKKNILSIAFILIPGLTSLAQKTDIPAELKPFIMPGYEVLDYAKEDMNNDKLPDYILILKSKEEETMTFDNANWDAGRPLLILTRKTNGSLQAAAINHNLVLCKNCGGVMGDPYQNLNVKPGEFTVDFYGGSSWRWTESYTFRFDKIKKNWFLELHNSSYFQSGDPEATMEETFIRRNETGNIKLDEFSPYYNTDNREWKVKAVKTYFYTSPELRSKPKKAFLVKGDKLTSARNFTNFIFCTYTNRKGEITSGYILKKDLQLLQTKKPKAL